MIGIASGKTSIDELAAAGADVVLDNLENLPQLLDAIAMLTTNDA